MNNKITILFPYPPNIAPGQRFRWEQWYFFLKERFKINKVYFSDSIFLKLRSNNNILQIIYYFYLYFIFFFKIAANFNSSIFVIYRNCTMIGPPFYEIILKILNKKIIYDFDDAIYLGSERGDNFIFSKFIRCDWKVDFLIKIADIVIVGNETLAKYAKKINKNTEIIPTTVNTNHHRYRKRKLSDPITIGWTGSASTSFYIKKFVPFLKKLQKKYFFKILIIGSKLKFNSKDIECIPWNLKSEIADLKKIDIGIMPLKNDLWAKGKCGFKIIQYLSLGIPAVASNVGINNKIIQHGKNGFIVNNLREWRVCIKKLITNKKLILKMGRLGVKTMKKKYTSKNVIPRLEKIIKSL